MSLRVRILLVAVPPLVGMLLLATVTTAMRWQHAGNMARVVQLSTLVDSIGALTQQLQSERGVVGMYLNSGGAKMRDDLDREQHATALREMDFQVKAREVGMLNPGVAAKLEQAQTLMQRSAEYWRRTRELTLQSNDSFAFYDDLIQSLLDVTPELAIAVQDSGAARSFLALFNFLEMEERAGQEEAIGAAGFALGDFSPQLLRRFNYAQREQNTLLQMFRSYATADELALLPRYLSTTTFANLNRLRSVADAGGVDGKLSVSASTWLAAGTARIGELRLVETALTREMQDRAMATSAKARRWLYLAVAGIAAMTALVIATALATIRSLALPLRRLTTTMMALADGDTSVQVPDRMRSDEVGDMARALGVLRDNRVAAELQQAERVADRAAQERRQLRIGVRITAFGTAVAGALQGMDAAGHAMMDTSGRLSGTASQSALQSARSVVAVGQASENAAAVAAAVATLAASAEEIGREAGAATVKITHATGQARQADSMVASLAVAAEQVGSVVSLVRAMATRTNMLALNATIEASRAGEAGRGFAVVASEVKALAFQTNQATAAIAGQIAAIQAAALEGSMAVQSIARSVDDAGTAALAVATAVKAQSAATGEITRYAREIAEGANQLQGGMSNANRAAAAAGQEAGAVRHAAEALGQQAGALRHEIEDFLAEIQAA